MRSDGCHPAILSGQSGIPAINTSPRSRCHSIIPVGRRRTCSDCGGRNAFRLDVLIAGAGLGGLTTALALIQQRHLVRLFEHAPEPREVGAGVQIGPNGSRLLIALGLQEAMESVVCVPLGREFRLWSTG